MRLFSSRPLARLAVPLLLATVLSGRLMSAPQAAAASPAPAERPSYFARLWHLDEAERAGRPWITFHRSNYALAASYNFRPNPAPLQAVDPAKTLVKPEVAFQLSFKAKLWQDLFGRKIDLWFAYTQRSFWQLYNFDDSSPFRETNYEPEVLINFRTDFRLLGLRTRFVQVGLNHQSNGQSEPLSRSWNRLVANVGLEKGAFSLLLKGWFHFPESPEVDDNPGINSYMGYGEVWAYWIVKSHRLGIMLRDNLDFQQNRGALQLEWSFPLFANVGGHVQYFVGYGESLLDYDHLASRIGVGFVFSDWD